jgi:diacylglycerol kinase (ATP)
MRVVVLYNPASGRGNGAAVAREIAQALQHVGHHTDELAIGRDDASRERLAGALADAGLLVVAGGDGTLHAVLSHAIASRVPVYHAPMGTENLFARQFGMSRSPGAIAAAASGAKVLDVDAAWATVTDARGPRERFPFALMFSLGPDAGVIHRLDSVRRGPISHASYVMPIAREVLSPWLPRVTVEVDGQRVVDAQRGLVVVANSRQYAMRIDPAMNASMTDGLLDAVFFPASGGLAAGAWMVRARMRSHVAAAVYVTGRRVMVRTDDASPRFQMDGEAGRAAGPGLTIEAQVQPGALRVLVPVD